MLVSKNSETLYKTIEIKCDLCDYSTNSDTQFHSHITNGKYWHTIIIVCYNLYNMRPEQGAKQHLLFSFLAHKDLSQDYFCVQCDYRTKMKPSLLQHMSSTHSMDGYPCDEECFTSAPLDSPCRTKECCQCNGCKYDNQNIAKSPKGCAHNKGLQSQQQKASSSSSGIIKKPVIIKFADRKKLLFKEHSSLNKRKQDPIQPCSILQTMSEQRFSTYLDQGPIIESSLNSGANISISEYDEQTDTLHDNIDSCSGDEEFDNEMSALAESLTIPTEQWVSNILDNNGKTGENNIKLVQFAKSQCKFQNAPTDIDKDQTKSCIVSTSSSKTSSVVSLDLQLSDDEKITGLEASNRIEILSREQDPNNKFEECNHVASNVENDVFATNENIIGEKLLTEHTKSKGSVVNDYDKTNKFKSSSKLKDNTYSNIHSPTAYDKQPKTLV